MLREKFILIHDLWSLFVTMVFGGRNDTVHFNVPQQLPLLLYRQFYTLTTAPPHFPISCLRTPDVLWLSGLCCHYLIYNPRVYRYVYIYIYSLVPSFDCVCGSEEMILMVLVILRILIEYYFNDMLNLVCIYIYM